MSKSKLDILSAMKHKWYQAGHVLHKTSRIGQLVVVWNNGSAGVESKGKHEKQARKCDFKRATMMINKRQMNTKTGKGFV